MDVSLLREFRERVNKNGWVYNQYRNKDGKNKWSVICSAMDWIEVCVEEIDINKLLRENNNQASVLMMKFINCIDVMWEAIQQLHRVFFNTQQVPFQKENVVFTNKIVPKYDNEYFMTIRACFSAHQINISESIEPEDKCTDGFEGKERWYASWSGNFQWGGGDFSVFLYSNNPERKPKVFSLNFEELMEFARIRYNYLREIMAEINRQEEDYKQEKRKVPIKECKDIVSQIDVLREANRNREKIDYYEELLRELKIIFTTPIESIDNKKKVERYRERLKPIIGDIQKNIQMMEHKDIELEEFIRFHGPEPIRYFFAKLCEYVNGDECYALVDESFFTNYIGDKIDLTVYQSYEELYVLILTGDNLERFKY